MLDEVGRLIVTAQAVKPTTHAACYEQATLPSSRSLNLLDVKRPIVCASSYSE